MDVLDNEKGKQKKYENKEIKPFFPRSELDFCLPFWEKLVFFIIGFVGVNIIGVLVQFILLVTPVYNPETQNYTKLGYALMQFLTYLILGVIFALFIFLDKRKTYKRVFMGFANWKSYAFGLGGFAAVFLVNLIFSLAYSTVPNYGVNNNQATLDMMMKGSPVLMFFATCLIGPFCEEMTYRVGLQGLISKKNTWLGIILTSIIFGFIHFDFNSLYYLITERSMMEAYMEAYKMTAIEVHQYHVNLVLNEVMNLPIYILSGFALGFTYAKSGNLASSLIAHIIVNTISFASFFIQPEAAFNVINFASISFSSLLR